MEFSESDREINDVRQSQLLAAVERIWGQDALFAHTTDDGAEHVMPFREVLQKCGQHLVTIPQAQLKMALAQRYERAKEIEANRASSSSILGQEAINRFGYES